MPLDGMIAPTQLRVVHARELLKHHPDELWVILPDGKFRLVFDDGHIDTTTRATLLSQYCWWGHREYPNTPLLIKHHFGNNLLTSNHISNVMGLASWAAYHANPGKIDPEWLALRIRQELNRMRNTANYALEKYVTTMSAEDIVEILDHPTIAAANEKIQSIDFDIPSNLINAPRFIEETHGVIRKVLMDPNELRTNRMARAIRAKMIDIQQILQCVGPRGLVTDLDSTVFKKPVVRGFGQGLNTLYQAMAESRSATKSLMLTKDPLADTEYFNREMQLICSVIKTLYHNDDCGSTEYTPWLVHRNNLEVLDGLHHVEDGQLKIISPQSGDLIGKTVLLRTAMTCRHKDPNGICGVCFGRLTHNVPRKTNIGYVSSTELCTRTSQGVLSTKHNDMISLASSMILSVHTQRYLQVLPGLFEIGISPELAGLKINLIVAKEDFANLADVNLANNLDSLSPSKISQMMEVGFQITYEDGYVETNIVPVSTGSRRASFTTAFLKYMKQEGWSYTEDLNIKVDLSNWNRDLPIWELPRKHADMLEFMGSVETLVKNSGANQSKKSMDLTKHDNLALALAELHDLVSLKFSINITHLAVILRATMIRSAEEYDYRLPNSDTKREFGGFKQIMAMRSLSAMCAYQEQSSTFRNVLSYLVKKRAPHFFDAVLMPEDF